MQRLNVVLPPYAQPQMHRELGKGTEGSYAEVDVHRTVIYPLSLGRYAWLAGEVGH